MKSRPTGAAVIAAIFSALILAPLDGECASFGRNKVRYRPFEWKVLRTDHFEVHYYSEAEDLAYEVCEVAEKAWQSQADLFRLSRPPQRRVPIFLYATFHDFIQTNVTPEPLDEGVGGFTEVYKTRVVLPLSASPSQRRHVIEHELVHAHQMFLLYGEGMRSYSLYKSILVPLWFIEGVSEYASDAWDAKGRMMLRDAVLNDRLPPLWQLHSFNHLEPHDGYLGYKIGHSAVEYLTERYGEDKIPAILKGIEDARTFPQIFKEHVGVSLREFDKRWRVHLKETFWSEVRQKRDAEDYGRGLAVNPRKITGINSGPAGSPVDDRVAFLSDRRGERALFVLDKGKRPRKLFSGSGSCSLTGSPPDWSPDGRHIAVILKRGPRSVLALIDSKKGRISKEFGFPLPDIAQARYSPDGRSLAFVGFNGKYGEIYRVEVESGEWAQVTRDFASNTYPVYGSDGKTLIYSSEDNGESFLRRIELVEGAEPASHPLLYAGKPVPGDRPDVSPDGRRILFESGAAGAPNLYSCRPDGSDARQLTDARTGIYSGRYSRDGKGIFAVTYEHGSQNIYLLDPISTPDAPLADFAPKSREPVSTPAPEATPQTETSAPLTAGIPASKLGSGGQLSSLEGKEPVVARIPAPASKGNTAFRAPAETAVRPDERKRVMVPAAPLALSAVQAGPLVALSWSQVDAHAYPVSRYSVYRSTDPGIPGRLMTQIFDPGVTVYRDASWQYEIPYYYRVRAVGEQGEILASGTAQMEVPVEIWPEKYRLSLDSRLVDLFVLVGSITVGGGTNFAGYGLLQLSDLPGNHRFLLQANAVPGWSNSYGMSYQFGGVRPDLGFSVTAASWSRFALVQNSLSTESFQYPPVVTDIAGAYGMMSYPFNPRDRIELSAGFEQFTEVFTDRDDEEIMPEKTSRLFPVSLAFVHDASRWRRLLPSGGGRLRLEAAQTMPLGGGALNLTEYSAHAQIYRGLGYDAALAFRWWGVLSTGHGQPGRTYYLGGRYSIRAHPVASQQGNLAFLGNHELRINLLKHINIQLPLLPILFTDIQGVGFVDVGMAKESSENINGDDFRAASIGGGINWVGFMFQSQPIMFALEVARRIDQRQPRPTVYGRLGPLF